MSIDQNKNLLLGCMLIGAFIKHYLKVYGRLIYGKMKRHKLERRSIKKFDLRVLPEYVRIGAQEGAGSVCATVCTSPI